MGGGGGGGGRLFGGGHLFEKIRYPNDRHDRDFPWFSVMFTDDLQKRGLLFLDTFPNELTEVKKIRGIFSFIP